MSDVLAFGPHPDDLELAAGGTLAKLAREGKDVVLCDLTRGERATRGTPEERGAEALAAARALGVRNRMNLELPDGGVVATDGAQLSRVVAAIRQHRPRLVIGLHSNDDHPDHIEGGALVQRAVYLAGLRNYPSSGNAPHVVERTLFAMGRRPFEPSLVVDVTASYAQKREAIAAFVTQFRRTTGDPLVTPISDPGFLERVEARDRTYGGMIGVAFGEPFFHRGPWPVRDFSQLFPEGGS